MVFSKKKNQVNIDTVETIIGAGTHIQGIITAQGTVRIDGSYNGDVKAQGDLIVGENGLVEGNFEARNIAVSGQLNGNIYTTGKVEINGSGKVFGDLNCKNLVIDSGAVFKGNCIMDFDPQIHQNVNHLEIEEVAK